MDMNAARTYTSTCTRNNFMLRGVSSPFITRSSHALRRCHCCTTGSIGLRVVMELDDLCSLKIGRCLLCKLHHEHCTDCEVGCNQTVTASECFLE